VSLGIPAVLAPALFARAFSWLFLVYSAFCLIASELLLLVLGIEQHNLPVVGAGLILGLPGFVLWRIFAGHAHVLWGVAYLVSLGATLTYATTLVIGSLPEVDSTVFTPLFLASAALPLVCGISRTRLGRTLWALGGYLVALLATGTASWLAGVPWVADARLAIVVALELAGILLMPALIARSARVQPVVDALADSLEAQAVEAQVVRRAASNAHDTLLATLAALGMAQPGRLDPQLREDIEGELARFHSDAWAANLASGPQAGVPAPIAPTDIDELVTEMAARGVLVRVSGSPASLGVLDPDRRAVALAALSQSLANVAVHANTDSAELVLFLDREAGVLSLSVVDGGVGFDIDAVQPDRLGLRLSVRDRIESIGGSVRVWSRPGQGTALMMLLPLEVQS
jgi:signal transduction histidine kinase